MMIELTKAQADCISHRLDAEDALVDVLTETFGWSEQDIRDRVTRLSNMVAGRRVDETALDRIEQEILIDCIEGSTWAACAYDASPQRHAAAIKTLFQLADKFNDAGLTVKDVPRH